MSEEIFDVVDEQDQIIGRAPRSEVHRSCLRHRAVHVLVFNGRGELFLQKRSQSKDTFPGAWDSSASGHLCRGEDYDACAIRELEEEIGLIVERAPERLFKLDACAETGWEHVWVYRYHFDGALRLNAEEIEIGGWFAPETIAKWIAENPQEFASAFPKIWQLYRDR